MTSSFYSIAEELAGEKELQANFIRLNVVRSALEIRHKEDGAFTPLGKTVDMTENSIDLILGREFVRHWPFSMSLFVLLRGNVASAGEQDSGDEENIDFNESLHGFGYGIGGSLNFNVRINKMRTQFFVSAQSVKQKNNYFLRYSDDDSDERSIEIETNDSSTVIQSGIGIRFYNLFNGYTFSLAAHHHDYTSDQIDFKASQGSDNEIELLSNPEFTRGNTAYSIGLGGTF